jgi:hypothetical protein
VSRFERYGVMGTEADGVFFTEATVSGATVLGNVKASSNRQNTSLDALKQDLARQVKALGGNCCVEFKYAQKATVFSFSSTQWNASGRAARPS